MPVPAYCSFEFLLHLFKNKNFADFKTESEAICFLQLRELIAFGAEVSTNATHEKINEHLENPYIKHLAKENRIESNATDFLALQNDERGYFANNECCNGVYCMSDMLYSGQRLAELQRRSGNYFLNSGSNLENIFQDKVEDLLAGNETTWDFLQQMIDPHRAIVIADPYIFKPAGIIACQRLLERIVPKAMYSPYHITLIGSSDRRGLHPSIPLSKIQNLIATLRQGVNKTLPHAIIEFHVVNSETFHDRLIITNNVMIYCGSGLSAINNHGEATRDSYWVAVSPFKRLKHNKLVGSFGYKAIKEKLERFKAWIGNTGQPNTTNPLFR